MSITTRRKSQFCHHFLTKTRSKIGFADIGSGGELKFPWSLLPPDKINKFDFDPEELRSQELPVCISNQGGERPFYIANDPRASSLHKPSDTFATRFNQPSLLTTKKIQVMCTTLDQHFAGRFDEVDLIDVNAEGHDYQVLQGATRLLAEGFVKCIKVEFELVEVWQGQGWFSDIDSYLRNKQYDLVSLDVEYGRPANVRGIYHQGEPIWGKAIYAPNLVYWSQRQEATEPAVFKEDLLKAIVLYTILDIPGRALELLTLAKNEDRLINLDEIASKILGVYKFARTDSVLSGLNIWLKRLITYTKIRLGGGIS